MEPRNERHEDLKLELDTNNGTELDMKRTRDGIKKGDIERGFGSDGKENPQLGM